MTKYDYNSIAILQIEECMNEKNINVTGLAALTDIPIQFLQKMLDEEYPLDFGCCIRICKALNIDISMFMSV